MTYFDTHQDWCEHLYALHQLSQDHESCLYHKDCQVPQESEDSPV